MTKRVIHVGVGSFGKRWCREFLAANIADGTIEVVAIVDMAEAALAFGARACWAAAPSLFPRCRRGLRRGRRQISARWSCRRIFTRRWSTRRIAHGLDILCEKPIADTMAGRSASRGRCERPAARWR